MRRFLIGVLASIGGLLVLLVLGGAAAAWLLLPRAPSLPSRILLTADWRGELSEAPGRPDLLALDFRPRPSVTDVVLALDAAAADPRVAGLLVQLADTANGLGATQELRAAVARFRAAGKYAIAYAETFGELSSGNEGYYLATAFDEIELQQIGLVGLTGLGAQVPLARDFLASLGIDFEVLRRAEYKTALETVTDSQLTGPNREQLESLLETLNGQFVSGIAEGRKLPQEDVRKLIDRGPFSGEDALAARLIDAIRYRDESRKLALRRAGPGAGTVDLDDYAGSLAAPARPAARVALVRATGLIRRGSGAFGTEIAADDMVETLGEIADSRDIDAVVLRIDSGGGSAVASETIREALQDVRAHGKPVVVSMSNTAASGGYWIAMAADRIVAQPGTLTGSIGVVAGKPVLAEAWRKLGVNWAEITRGANAGIWTVNEPFSGEARARVDALVGWLYDRFTSLVADARQIPQQRVQELAKGRVWAGATAAQLGLVDELGGLDEALAAVRRVLKLPADAQLSVEPRPLDHNPAHWLLRLLRPLAGTIELALGLGHGLGAGTAMSLPVEVR